MSKSKRLFLLAAYDKHGFVDDSLIYYIKNISKYGDIIVCFDCTCTTKELTKISCFCLRIINGRHEEYDFGSYKRAYNYAFQHNLLEKYDYIYMVNDSVYGPLNNLKNIFETLEKFNTQVFGIIQSEHRIYFPIESWFIGMNTVIAQSDWFYKFITSVCKQSSKENVTIAYENGFTDLLIKHNIIYKCLITVHGREMYNKPIKMFKLGCPFIKKASFTRHNGAIGYQINNILNKTTNKNIFISSAKRLYGDKYIDWLLTNNPIKCLERNIKYVLNKKI